MANPIAVPGTNVPSGAAVSPGGAQGPSAVSANANNKATLGSDSLVLVQGTAAGVAATTHAQTVSGDDPQLTNARTPTAHEASHVTGSDQIPLAGSSTKGLLNQTSGNTTDFIDGTNNSQPLQPVIWSVRLRSLNILQNPNFEVDQRFVGAAATVGTGAFTAGPDRWSVQKTAGTTLTANAAQGSLVSPNYPPVPGTSFAITSKILRVTLTGQQASLAAGDILQIVQQIEGPLVREVFSDVTSLSVLARTSGPSISVGVGLRDGTTITKSLVKLCTIPGTAWTLVTMPNIPVFPAGNFVVTPGGIGLIFTICLAAGSTSVTPANDTWQSGNYMGAVGQTNFASLPVNTYVDFAFLQYEPGALCTTLQDCQFQQNYDACLRFYQKSYDLDVAPGTAAGVAQIALQQASTTLVVGPTRFHKPMAKIPTCTAYNPSTGAANAIFLAGTSYAVTSFNTIGKAGFLGINTATLPAVSAGSFAQVHYTAETGW